MHQHIFLFGLLVIFGSIIEAAPLSSSEAELKKRLDAAQSCLREKEEDFNLQKAIADSLRDQLNKTQSASADLQKRLNTTHESLRQKNTELENLKAKAQNQSEEISRLKREIGLLNKKQFELTQQIKSLQGEKKILQERNARDAVLNNRYGTDRTEQLENMAEEIKNLERRAKEVEIFSANHDKIIIILVGIIILETIYINKGK